MSSVTTEGMLALFQGSEPVKALLVTSAFTSTFLPEVSSKEPGCLVLSIPINPQSNDYVIWTAYLLVGDVLLADLGLGQQRIRGGEQCTLVVPVYI